MPIKDAEKRCAYHRKYIRDRYTNDPEYRKAHLKCVANRNAKYRDELRDWVKTLRCTCCGEADWACIDFHHRDPSAKEISIGRAMRQCWSRKRLKAEIAKCTILCSNCHRKLHRDLREKQCPKNPQ